MGIAGGVKNLDWMFTGTFLAMVAVVPLFGWITSNYPRRKFIPLIYYFFIINIFIFYALLKSDLPSVYVGRVFFIWVSVYNLFVVSVFWSFMADIFNNERAKRLFGFIAAGGTAGALVGPAITGILVIPLGGGNLLLISIALLGISILCVHKLLAWQNNTFGGEYGHQKGDDQVISGSIWSGIKLVFASSYLLGVCILILLYTTLATFLYFQQAEIIEANFADGDQRTAVFAGMDFATNALTVLVQVFFTGRILKKIGLSWSLAVIPIGLAIGFFILAMSPVLAVLVVFQVVRRAGNFALMKPSREMLFVVLDNEKKYKAKNFIDTTIYRGGDAVSAWVYSAMQALGLSLSGIALVAVPLCGVWSWVSFRLGKQQEALATKGFSVSQKENHLK